MATYFDKITVTGRLAGPQQRGMKYMGEQGLTTQASTGDHEAMLNRGVRTDESR